MRRDTNRDEGCDPLIRQDLLKACILIAEHELVDKRCHNRLVAFRRKRWNVITNDRARERRRRWTGKQGVDHGNAARACSGEQVFNLRNGADATPTTPPVAALLYEINHKDRGGLPIKSY